MQRLTFVNKMRLQDAIERYLPHTEEDATEGFVTETLSNVVSTLKKPLDVFSRGMRTMFNARPGNISSNAITKCVRKEKPFDWSVLSKLGIPEHPHQSEDGDAVAQTLNLLSASAVDIVTKFIPSVQTFYRELSRNPSLLASRVTPTFPDGASFGFKLNELTERYYDCFGASANRSGRTTVGDSYERLGDVYKSIEDTNSAVTNIFDRTNPKTVEKQLKELNRLLFGFIRVAKEHTTPDMRKLISDHVGYVASCIEFYGLIASTVVAQQAIMEKTVETIEEHL